MNGVYKNGVLRRKCIINRSKSYSEVVSTAQNNWRFKLTFFAILEIEEGAGAECLKLKVIAQWNIHKKKHIRINRPAKLEDVWINMFEMANIWKIK